ncbi:uncharacterized protein LOC126827563 [Patella vulgata]|uniref:uncharacterized protein LOC126827563 n=1 Tax=Patella vulgata TaxID=6465 RepID=UPI0024A7DFF2|nr:uncharacterized protein LOC126827563 [Patella vulgata]
MVRSHREVFSLGVAIIALSVGVVVSMNCDNSSVPPVVPFCSALSVSGRVVYLSGITFGTNGIDCNCYITITTSTQYPVEIKIRNVTTASNKCDYSLHSVYKNNNQRLYSCGENITKASFDLNAMETVKLHMEIGTNNSAGFPFCLELVGQGSNILLACMSKSTTTVSTTTLTYMKLTSTINFKSTISNTSTGRKEGTRYTTAPSNTSSAIPSTTESQPNNGDTDRLIGIIVGSIVGLLVVIALVIIIVCLVKRRKTKPPYETPLEPQDRPHVNAAVTPNNNANGHNNQNTQVGNHGMIYLENDLYKSIDDDEPVGRKGSNHEGMIYLENDLYISSNDTDNVHQDAENSVSHQPVEYAVVNKTAKKSSSGNGASTGHTV